MIGTLFQYYFMKILNFLDVFSMRCRTLAMSHNAEACFLKVIKINILIVTN